MAWKEISKETPPMYHPILMAFEDHWNPVAGFYAGLDRKTRAQQFYQHTAHDHNQVIVGGNPEWWDFCPRVPHDLKATPEAPHAD